MSVLSSGFRLLAGLVLAISIQGVGAQPKDQVKSILDQWAKAGKLKILGPSRPIPTELTDEQQAMLTESPDLFPYIEVTGVSPGYPNFLMVWMDEKRLIMSVRRLGEWHAADHELSKIVVFHTDTGKFEETLYRGVLECYTPERMVVMPNTKGWQGRGDRPADKSKPYEVLVGQFGKALKVEEYSGYETSFNKFTCRAFNGKMDPPANENYWMHPLRDGDGAVGYTVAPKSTPSRPRLVMFDADGKTYAERALGTELNLERWFYYNTTTRRYFYSFSGDRCGDSSKGSAIPGVALSFRPGEGWEEHTTPALMTNMLDWCMLQWLKIDTAAGIVYTADSVYNPQRHKPRYHRGLYIQLGDKVHRFFKAHADISAVSPSGCRIFVAYKPDKYDPSPGGDIAKARIFDVCQGEKN